MFVRKSHELIERSVYLAEYFLNLLYSTQQEQANTTINRIFTMLGENDSEIIVTTIVDTAKTPKKHLSPFIHALMAFKHGKAFQDNQSTQRNERLQKVVESDGPFAIAHTVSYSKVMRLCGFQRVSFDQHTRLFLQVFLLCSTIIKPRLQSPSQFEIQFIS